MIQKIVPAMKLTISLKYMITSFFRGKFKNNLSSIYSISKIRNKSGKIVTLAWLLKSAISKKKEKDFYNTIIAKLICQKS